MNAAERAVAALKAKGAHVSFAESLTGGLIAAALISVSGASAVIGESYVTYAPEAKIRLVRVSPETVNTVGVVSERCAREMAEGVRLVSGADYGVSATGLAGPDGGTEETPVGTVFIAASSLNGTIVRRLRLEGSRQSIREQSTEAALELLCEIVA